MKIAICDDDARDIAHLRESIVSHSDKHEIIEFLSAKPFLERFYSGEHFDLLFLDVHMPDSDGWEIAKDLMMAKRRVFIAMVTVHGEYIYDCFDRVNWFAEKPVSRERVWQILTNAQEQLYPKVFEFQTEGITVSLSLPEIRHLEVRRNLLYVHTFDKCYEVRMPLKKAKEALKDFPSFAQTHNSFIVNLHHYNCIKEQSVVLNNQVEITLSRTYRASFLEALEKHIRGV